MGFIKSLNYSFPDNATWETQKGKRVPKLVTVAISYQVVHASVPGMIFDNQTGIIDVTKFFGYAGEDWDETPANLKEKIQPDQTYYTQ